MKNLVIIPTYNEVPTIETMLKAISNQNLSSISVLVVDDGSPDGTSKIVKELDRGGKLNNKVYVLDRIKKEGLGKAYVAGFKWAIEHHFDRIISMDADFSHDPKYLPEILRKAKEYDVVIGSRYVEGGKIVGWKWFRYLNSWSANLFTRMILGLKPKDSTAGFKCYDINFIKSLDLDNIVSGGYALQVEMVVLAQEHGCSIYEVPITFVDRKFGETKISGELPRSIKAIFQLASRKKSYRQFVKFGIIGVLGTIVDLGLFNLFVFAAHFNIYFARAISFTFGATNNYIFNRKWTFKSKDKKVAQEYGKFFFVSLIGLGLNLIIMKLSQGLVDNIDNEVLKKNIPVIIAIAIVLFWNFFANKLWTFKKYR